jgi:hypothetical protein
MERHSAFYAIELMLTSANNLVSIGAELRLKTFSKLFGEQNFKILSNQETSIALDLISIAFPKESLIVEPINKV